MSYILHKQDFLCNKDFQILCKFCQIEMATNSHSFKVFFALFLMGNMLMEKKLKAENGFVDFTKGEINISKNFVRLLSTIYTN